MWSDIKGQISNLENAELIQLIGELYRLTATNQKFLSARFASADLKLYLDTIDEGMYPDANRRDWSVKVASAKRVISEYTRAVPADHDGAAELKIFFVERGIEFCLDHGYFHEPLCQALLRMYISAIGSVQNLPVEELSKFRSRLQAIIPSISEIDETFGDAFRQQYENSIAEGSSASSAL